MEKARIKHIFGSALLLLAAAGCGSHDSFTVDATIDGLGTQNVRIIWYDGQKVCNDVVTAVDSHFRYEASAQQPSVIEFYSNARTLLGRTVAQNGDNLILTLKVSDPEDIKADGNATAAALAKWLRDNPVTEPERTEAIAAYAAKHSDEPLSAVLLGWYYDIGNRPERADSLLRTLDRDKVAPSLTGFAAAMLAENRSLEADIDNLLLYTSAHPDSAVMLKAGKPTIYGFVGSNVAPADLRTLDSLGRAGRKVTVVLLSADTTALRSLADSLPHVGTVAMAPGGAVNPSIADLVITRRPTYILTDSAGHQQARSSLLPNILTKIE